MLSVNYLANNFYIEGHWCSEMETRIICMENILCVQCVICCAPQSCRFVSKLPWNLSPLTPAAYCLQINFVWRFFNLYFFAIKDALYIKFRTVLMFNEGSSTL